MRSLRLLLLCLTMLALTAPAAHAERWHGRDASGDVRSFQVDLGDSPCVTVTGGDRVPGDRRRDLTRLTVDHGSDVITVDLALRDVAKRDRDTSYEAVIRTPAQLYLLAVYSGPHVHRVVDFQSARVRHDHDGCFFLGVHDRACEGLDVLPDPSADLLTVQVPRTCLGTPRWVRVGASAGALTSSRPGSSTVIRVEGDSWGSRDEDLFKGLPQLSPRVRAG